MRIFSGIQPTGEMHIGNYLGAVKHWVELQKGNQALYSIVDLHALTTPQSPQSLRRTTLEKVVEFLAVGLNPEQCILFVQSHVQEHAELAWIFDTIVPVGELERMTQYKDKSRKQKNSVNVGLLAYPVLMAADILLYKSQGVPVGKDQTQHLELARTIARKFNTQFGETFPKPKALVPKQGAKIMSLQDPKRKMSKSDGPQTFISLFEEPESIRNKVMKATTDASKEIVYNPIKKPGVSNLLVIYSLFSEQSIKDTEKKFQGKGYASLKKSIAELLVDKLGPFRRKKKELQSRELYLKEVLKHGAKKAHSLASATMEDVRSKLGLLAP